MFSRQDKNPPDDSTRTQITPAAERERDSALCRSFMRGKSARGSADAARSSQGRVKM